MIIIITIIIRLKRCNAQKRAIAFGMTSKFVDKHSPSSSNSAGQPCFISGFAF